MANDITVNYNTYSTVEVTNLADANSVDITSGDVVNVVVSEEAVTPTVVIETGLQGPPGTQGVKGDPLTYEDLTADDVAELAQVYDNVVGQVNYTNVFLNALLN
jgi:hypothetical protein